MAFERRGASGVYMYFASRDPATGRVKKTYIGRGPRADAAALARRREQREADRRAVRAAQDALRDLDALTAEMDDAASLLMEAVLLAGGFHRHNYGRWRRVRDGHGRHGVAALASGSVR